MTQEEKIIEYNRRCAEFLEMEFDIHSSTWRYKDLITTTLLFHSDWNWIMEVVEAIEKLTVLDSEYVSSYNFIIDCFGCSIETTGYRSDTILTINNNNRKEAIVDTINQFLIWYNKNK